jgi:hypothetical protein
MKYELGIEVKDIITGCKGIVTGRTEYLTGCNHYGIAPQKKKADGAPAEWQWFDESRLIATGKKLKGYVAPGTSGPVPNAPSM